MMITVRICTVCDELKVPDKGQIVIGCPIKCFKCGYLTKYIIAYDVEDE